MYNKVWQLILNKCNTTVVVNVTTLNKFEINSLVLVFPFSYPFWESYNNGDIYKFNRYDTIFNRLLILRSCFSITTSDQPKGVRSGNLSGPFCQCICLEIVQPMNQRTGLGKREGAQSCSIHMCLLLHIFYRTMKQKIQILN